jgi:plastocyanin
VLRGLRSVARRLVLATAASSAIALAACSGSGGAAASPVATNQVDLPASYKFAPAVITVHAGTAVTWTNHDNFTHSVQFLDGGLPNDPRVLQPGGSTTSFTFTTAGTFHYQCSFHPQNMQGTVIVTP